MRVKYGDENAKKSLWSLTAVSRHSIIVVVLWMWPPSRRFPLSPPRIYIRSEFVVHASTPLLTSRTDNTWAEVWRRPERQRGAAGDAA
jgi:hypothetical protein